MYIFSVFIFFFHSQYIMYILVDYVFYTFAFLLHPYSSLLTLYFLLYYSPSLINIHILTLHNQTNINVSPFSFNFLPPSNGLSHIFSTAYEYPSFLSSFFFTLRYPGCSLLNQPNFQQTSNKISPSKDFKIRVHEFSKHTQ